MDCQKSTPDWHTEETLVTSITKNYSKEKPYYLSNSSAGMNANLISLFPT